MTWQGAWAVLAGFAAMTAVVMIGMALMMALLPRGEDAAGGGGPSRAYIAGDLAVGLIAALGGGALASWLAPFAPMHHAGGLAVLVIVMSIVCAFGSAAGQQPRGYQVVLGVGAPVAVMAGAFVSPLLG